MTARRLGLLYLVSLNGCSTVEVLDDDGSSIGGSAPTSASSSSTGNGGAVPVPRIITLEFLGNGEAPIDDGRVLVSDADGTLRAAFLPSALPVEVAVTDGQLVSFLRDTGIVGSNNPLRIDSFRVTPNVMTKIVGGKAPWAPPCDVQPMTVTVSFAAVPDATAYEATASDYAGAFAGASSPGLSTTLQVATCDATFDVLATARSGGTFLGHELFQALPFVSGGQLDLSTTTSSTERAPLDITIEGLEGAVSLLADASWQHPPMSLSSESVFGLQMASPPPVVVSWSPAPILPGGPGYGDTALFVRTGLSSHPDGACSSGAGLLVVAPAPGVSQTISVDHKLARVEAVGASGWELTEPSELGDYISVSMHLGGEDDPFWYLLEDPSFPTISPSFPDLPTDLAAALIPPSTTPTLHVVGHWDRDHVAGYGDIASGVAGAWFGSSGRWNGTGYLCD